MQNFTRKYHGIIQVSEWNLEMLLIISGSSKCASGSLRKGSLQSLDWSSGPDWWTNIFVLKSMHFYGLSGEFSLECIKMIFLYSCSLGCVNNKVRSTL